VVSSFKDLQVVRTPRPWTLCDRPLERVHFPTGRFSIEGIVRLLAEEFDVPTNRDAAIWRPVLAASEREFLEIAHLPLSGPSA